MIHLKRVILLGLVVGLSYQADAVNCGEITLQLAEMQKAQALLLQTMVKKNENLAEVLDRYASEFEDSERKLTRSDIQSMHGSANAFRNHEAREQTLVDKFNRQSRDLITKANACLASSNERTGNIATQNQ